MLQRFNLEAFDNYEFVLNCRFIFSVGGIILNFGNSKTVHFQMSDFCFRNFWRILNLLILFFISETLLALGCPGGLWGALWSSEELWGALGSSGELW